jgi:Methylamine utilization protein MauJ
VFLAEKLQRVARRLDPVVTQERWPTVSTPITDANDYEAERLAMARFLSAVAYETRQGMEVLTGGGAGVPQEFDPPVATAVRPKIGAYMFLAPVEVVVVNDDRLRLVLAYCREGLSTESPYFKFLAFWNALEVACDDLPAGAAPWVRTAMQQFPGLARSSTAPADWWGHLENERRHAVAHAIRDPSRGVADLDTDDPDTRSNFYADAGLLDDLVRMRVRERWGEQAVSFRRRRT